ncbi:MAG: hypothetical protein JNJ54_29705 [Myxococcaceae bacterium]|nr:hypothetical protein [Myxococcaceae bacterium]
MKRWSWCVVSALVVSGVACGPSRSGTDAGRTGGGFTGGGTGGAGGGTTGGGFGGSGGGTSGGTGGGRAGGSAGGVAGGAAGGMAGGDAGGSAMGGGAAGGQVFDGGGLSGGETCTTAVIVPGSSAVITSTTAGAVNDYLFASGAGCASSTSSSMAPDVAYSVVVPPGQRLTASVTTTWDATINLIAAPPATCGDDPDGGVLGPATCLAGADVAAAGTDTTTYLNSDAVPVTVFVVIDGYSAGEGDFTLAIDVAPPAQGDDCTTAVPVQLSDAGVAVLPAESMGGFGSDFSSANSQDCAFAAGPDRVYSFTIPAGLRLTARATSSFNLLLSTIDDVALCGASPVQCSAAANQSFSGMTQTETLVLDNGGTTPRPVLLVVDATTVPAGATFGLELSVGPVPPGDTCMTAVAAPFGDAGVVLPAESLNGFASDFSRGSNCEFGSGPDRVYGVVVPPNLRLTARAISNDNLALSAIGDPLECTATTPVCVAGVDTVFMGSNQTETLTVDNPTSSPLPVLLVVDSIGAPTSSFSLELSAGPIPPGETCALPQALTLATDAGVPDGGVPDGGATGFIALQNEPLLGYASDFSFFTNSIQCTFGNGPDRVFQVPVGPGQRLRATVSGVADLALNLVQDAPTCRMDPLVCLAEADMNGSGTAGMPEVEALRYDNTSATARSMVLIVDSFGSASAPFDLDVRVGPIPPPAYTVSMLSGMCDSFASVTPVPLLTDTTTPALSDESVTDTLALPFAFSYFGQSVTHYSASSNGFLQLFTSAMGMGDTAASNDPLPTAGAPDGVVAPFWDDLNLINASSRVIGGVFGSGSTRHLTVQWEQVMRYGVMGSSMTFQARLYETTNVIELQACSLTPGTDPGDADLERGLEATIGLESVDGFEAIQTSYDMPFWTAGQVIRYTP